MPKAPKVTLGTEAARNYAAIKFAAALIIANPHEKIQLDRMQIIDAAVAYADELIEQLQERDQ